MSTPSLILASASPTRAEMLRNAGLEFSVMAAAVDEDDIKQAMRAEGADVATIADALAALKAQRVSTRHPEALVIGVDQMLECEGDMFDKPIDRDAGRRQLLALRGNVHQLISAVVVARGGSVIWRHADTAQLRVRDFSEEFLDRYLDEVGDAIFGSVGGYQLEGRGVQLFQSIRGDYFTILGLPLLPLLGFLREHKVIML